MSKIGKLKNGLKNAYLIGKKNHKNPVFIILDFFRLRRKNLISIEEYDHYNMAKQNFNFRNMFLPLGLAKKYWELLNPRTYACLARDKYLSHVFLEKLEVPVPKLIAYFNPIIEKSYGVVSGEIEKVGKLLYEYSSKEKKQIIVKPAQDSAHGNGVFIIERVFKQDGLYYCVTHDNANSIEISQFMKKTSLIFEEKVSQNNQFDSFNQTSVNTIRIMTALFPSGEIKVIAAFIKIGRIGSVVDNAGSGGNIDVAIDPFTGYTYNALQFDSWNNNFRINNHPDTGALLENIIIENWSEIINKIKSYQAKIPQIKIIGWDVAVTDDGPVIIEFNNWWDTTGQLLISRGWRYDVEECYNAWKEYYES